MGRAALWTTIRDTLQTDIAAGRYAPGDRLPTEAALATRFGVNRHTVRRALESLRETGLVHTRRGAGAFVAQRPTDYPLQRRMRFSESLLAAGQSPEKRILSTETRNADAREADMLHIAPGTDVHVYDALAMADGQPLALSRGVLPAADLPGLPDALRATGSVTAALRACGVSDYTRAWTRLTAKLATATQAAHLRLTDPAPILRTVSLNIDPQGRPLEYAHTWFAGDRITLTVAADGATRD